MIKRVKAITLIFLLVINSVGCYSYSQINMEDTEKIVEGNKAKITTIDEKVYILTSVTIDSLHIRGMASLSQSELLAGEQKKEIAILLEKIKEFEIRAYDSTLTEYVVLGIGFCIFLFIVIGSASLSSGSGYGIK